MVKSIITFLILLGFAAGTLFPVVASLYTISDKVASEYVYDFEDNSSEKNEEESKTKNAQFMEDEESGNYFMLSHFPSSKNLLTYYSSILPDHFLEINSPPPWMF